MWCTYLRTLSTTKYLLGVLLSVLIILVAFYNDYDGMTHNRLQVAEEQARRTHLAVVTEFMTGRENWTTSNFGSWLFKYNKHVAPRNRTFLIHFNDHTALGGKKWKSLEECSVQNCILTSDDRKLHIVDVVLVWLFRGNPIPKVKKRNPKQIWIFWNDEPPRKYMMKNNKQVNLRELADIFNWSMTYRTDSDIPVPYGRTKPLDEPVLKVFDKSAITGIIPYWQRKKRDVLVTTMMSNCMRFRMTFLNRLKTFIPVDVFGECSRNDTVKSRCPGHFNTDCDTISEYLFYLVLENSSCREYLSEKIWHNSYMKGAIPIILGPSIGDCKRFLPPRSYLHMTQYDYNDIHKLAKYITHLNDNDDLLISFHEWRNHFEIINEHAYFGQSSYWFCRLCEGLNYNDLREKVYHERDIKRFLDDRALCYPKFKASSL